MTSRWAAYAISISRAVVMRVFMLRGILSRDFRGNVDGRVGDRRIEQVENLVVGTSEPRRRDVRDMTTRHRLWIRSSQG